MVYRSKSVQLSIDSFGAGLSVKLSPENKWVLLANQLPWKELEEIYTTAFPSHLGRAGKPFRLLFGAQLIKNDTQLSDAALVAAIRDTPAYQYFIGITEYTITKPFTAPTMTYFRQRIEPLLTQINTVISKWVRTQLNIENSDNESIIIDATVFPVNIKFPQDHYLLNQARLNLEKYISKMAHQLEVPNPRTYKRLAHKSYVTFTKKPRRSAKETRKQVKAQLQYVRRDLRYVQELLDQGGLLTEKEQKRLETIQMLYSQQLEMFENHTHSVPNRIVSLQQNYVRPIKRGKAKQNTEFGPKVDATLKNGVIEIERISFDAFNESTDFIDIIERYAAEHGHYPTEVLADKLYRTRANIKYATEKGITIIGPKLGRKPKNIDEKQRRADNKAARDAENRRGEIERSFAFLKSKCDLGLVRSKTAETTVVSVYMGIILANIDAVLSVFSLGLNLLVKIDDKFVQLSYKIQKLEG